MDQKKIDGSPNLQTKNRCRLGIPAPMVASPAHRPPRKGQRVQWGCHILARLAKDSGASWNLHGGSCKKRIQSDLLNFNFNMFLYGYVTTIKIHPRVKVPTCRNPRADKSSKVSLGMISSWNCTSYCAWKIHKARANWLQSYWAFQAK